MARKLRSLTALALVALSSFPPGPARAAEVVMQKQYVLGIDTPSRNLFYISCNQAPFVGGVCFTVPPGATSVRLAIADATGRPGGLFQARPPGNGAPLAAATFCDDTPLPIPPGTDRIQVFVDGPGNASSCGAAAAGTVGTVTATFSISAGGGGPGYTPSQPIYGVLAERNQYVPSGGSTIQVDVYRPNALGTFPVLVWFDVYYKDDPGAVVNSERDYFVSRGYVFVHASSPGSNTSGGSYENAFGPAEQQAAYDVVEWAGVQPWSNGKVAMEGLSYAAIIEYFVAAMRPPHLVTVYPTSAYSDLYREIVYVGGNLQAGYPILWDANNRSLAYAPPQSVSSDPETQYANYATTLAGYRPILADFATRPHDDAFYEARSPATNNANTTVPVAIDVGWHDDMVYGGPINFETIGSSQKRLVIGPWGHSEAHRRPGGRDERLRWFDFYLKGLPSGVADDPRVSVFIPEGADDDAGTWMTSSAWPIPGTTHVSQYLGAGGVLADAPGTSGGARYLYSPTRHTEPAQTVDLGEDVSFETPPLSSGVTVAGYSELVLFASTEAFDTSFNVAVYDVDETGDASLLQRGWLRAQSRELDEARSIPGRPYHRFERDLAVPIGEIVEYRIAIWPFANRFPAGHRIRVTISDSTAGSGGAPAFMPLFPATNVVHFGTEWPSRLVLPVVG